MASAPPARTARLILVRPDGRLIGRLPEIAVATPWWQDVEPIVEAARTRLGVAPVILRLVGAERATPPGGLVSYLAEVESDDAAWPVEAWAERLVDDPLRQAFAKPGGPAADLAWAVDAARRAGQPVTERPVQVRTWHLSSVWRLPVADGNLWLKVTPPFAAPEGALLAEVASSAVAQVVAYEDRRCLLREAKGADLYNAPRDQLLQMVDLLVGLQVTSTGSLPNLRRIGVRVEDASTLSDRIARVVQRHSPALTRDVNDALQRFLADLPSRLSRLAECGLPDVLVHGDFHPGNVRGSQEALTLIDWSDAFVGNPLFDLPPFLGRIRPSDRAAVRSHWLERWRSAYPASAPERAADLIEPIVTARLAATYQMFLEQIEPTERAYHAGDPQAWLRHTAALVRDSIGGA